MITLAVVRQFALATSSCAFLCLLSACAEQGAPMKNATPDPAATGLSQSTARTVVYLDFFRRWDTPQDDAATRMFSRVVREAPDYKAFKVLAPAGSEERRLFEWHLAGFEEAGPLVRDGKMNEDLFFDAWYAMPQAWNRAKPYVLGMRAESGNQQLYRNFEWLAQRAEQFWAEREKHPPHWTPIATRVPTAGDRAVYAEFNRIWSTPRDAEAREFFAELSRRAGSFEEFRAIVKPASAEYIKFDRLMCAYDQAGALIKNGILHPKLFFDAWRSPAEIWRSAEPWTKGLRAQIKSPHLYDGVDWLVEYEHEWRAGGS